MTRNRSVSARPGERTHLLLTGPILATLLRLAAPNVADAAARIAFIACDAVFVSWLGTDALAGVTVVFPIFLLMQMMSAGGLGVGVSAAVARAMGAGERDDADAITWHAILLAVATGAAFTLIMLAAGARIYGAMGVDGAALDTAVTYSNLVFGGIVLVWLMNTLANAVRGTGNMIVPAVSVVAGEAVHLILSPALILGWGPLPSFGAAGAALGVLAAYLVGSVILLAYLMSGRGDIFLTRRSLAVSWRHFASILGVGIFAALNVAQSQFAVVLVSLFVATLGTMSLAGYGAASRLELLLIPLSFALGSAIIAMAATNAGAGNWNRVRSIARTGTALSTALGLGFGAAALAIPGHWMRLFSADPAVIEPGVQYLRALGLTYPLLGFGLGLFFTLMGVGQPIWPFLAGTARLLIVGGGGWAVAFAIHGSLLDLTVVVAAGTAALALGMLIAGRSLLFKP